MAQTFPTAAPDPYEPLSVPLGRSGLQWFVDVGSLTPAECRILTNLTPKAIDDWGVRPGLQRYGTTPAGTETIHTIRRLNLGGINYTRFWGVSTALWRGAIPDVGSGIGIIDTGYSGNPLTVVPTRPSLTGEPWALIADSVKMRQVSATGAPIPVGLAPASAGVSAEVTGILRRRICRFQAADTSAAANWTGAAGVDRSETPRATGIPTAADVTGVEEQAVAFTTTPGSATEGYHNILSLVKSLDLLTFEGGAEAGPEDIVHLFLKADRPDLIEEVRVYFVCSANFGAGVIPGQSATVNTDAFVKAFRPHDFTGFVESLVDALQAGQTSRSNTVLEEYLEQTTEPLPPENPPLLDGAFGDGHSSAGSASGGTSDISAQASEQLVPGRGAWSEFGVIGKPLRRREFLRIGGTPTATWGTISGIVLVIQTIEAQPVVVTCDDWYLTGGYNLDSSDPTSTPYDWRYTHYHTVTGDEGNPSPIMSSTRDCLRQQVALVPTAYGDSAVRQRVYRRGGTLPDDWYYVGQNSADGATFTDNIPDAEAEASGTLELDNDQPVSTITNAGATILAQPLPVVFGPVEGRLFGIGDSYRPGYLYYCKTGRWGSWPAANAIEVCPPSEALQNGVMFGGEAFLFSRERMYRVTVNLTASGTVAVQDTPNAHGLAARWAIAVGPDAIYYIARDGLRRTQGGGSELLSQRIRPLFFDVTPEPGHPPIDWSYPERIRLAVWRQRVYLIFRGADGTPQVYVCDTSRGEPLWFRWTFPVNLAYIASEEQEAVSTRTFLGAGGLSNGTVWELLEDEPDQLVNGSLSAITWTIQTGDLDADAPRADKELAEVVLDADIPDGATVSVTPAVNDGTTALAPATATGTGSPERYILTPFGDTPQVARNLRLTLGGTQPTTAATVLHLNRLLVMGRAIADIHTDLATVWESVGESGAEAYLTGCRLLIDTFGETIQFNAVTRLQGDAATAGVVIANTSGRRWVQASWPAVHADLVRLEPFVDEGAIPPWRLYQIEWQWTPEPGRIATWESNWESKGDSYYTGLDLECDTFGEAKQIEVWVDGVRITDPATGFSYFTITANGRRLIHLTFGSGRGHLFRFVAIDQNPGLLYSHQWMLAAEPGEQANWNQPYTVEGTLGDKFIKGVLIECDTFGQPKTVEVQIDGVTATILTITQNGRGVQHHSFAQTRGRVLRLWPTDANPGRLYQIQWIFDEEPLSLSRWETQLQDFGVPGWSVLYDGFVTYRSPDGPVTLAIGVYDQSGSLLTTLTTVFAASAEKVKRYLQPLAAKGVFFKCTATADVHFWLYRGESALRIAPWGRSEFQWVQPFGDDDLDKTRSLGRATNIAGTV